MEIWNATFFRLLSLEDQDNGMSGVMRELLGEIGERLRFIYDRLRKYDLTIQRLFREDERCRRVAAVEGVGPVTGTALVAVVGNAIEFRSGRELAAYLGLVPRHRANGGRTMLLGISKRGDRYLRTLLIHGARAALHRIERRRGARAIWAARLKVRRGAKVAAVALANKNARAKMEVRAASPDHIDGLESLCVSQVGEGAGSDRFRHQLSPL
jgi:transposase